MNLFINTILKSFIKRRLSAIENFKQHPFEVQKDTFKHLLSVGKETEYGKQFHFHKISSVSEFQELVPLATYEELYPFIERALKGEDNVLWSGKIKWFAKSSGTTNDKSKFIPITSENLQVCHYGGGRDMLALYFQNKENSTLFRGKSLTIGGSHQINQHNKGARYGDLSSVLIENLPWFYSYRSTPPKSISLEPNYEKKLKLMRDLLPKEKISCILGVPTWTLILLQNILQDQKANDLSEIWDTLEVFFHGGISFTPYRRPFSELCKSLNYFEIYNASEGLIGLQDDMNKPDLLLMLNRGIFYEFIPNSEFDKEHPKVVELKDVQLNETYAVVMTTNSGLWRYIIGDTVKFTSINPYKIMITGRTKHYINAFGEELMVDNADQAIDKASKETNAIVSDYTAAPIYLQKGKSGGHEWLIEFQKKPDDISQFITVLDNTLKEVNSDYEAKRQGNMAMQKPIIKVIPKGTFYQWMKNRNKLGGQNKVPRLSNHREYVDSILSLLEM